MKPYPRSLAEPGFLDFDPMARIAAPRMITKTARVAKPIGNSSDNRVRSAEAPPPVAAAARKSPDALVKNTAFGPGVFNPRVGWRVTACGATFLR